MDEFVNCTSPSVEEFPEFPLPHGPATVIIPLTIIAYCVLALATLCHDRFIPCIKAISFRLGLSSDVAGATLMAAGVSSPDLFINLAGTMSSGGDIGLGTVLGCGVVNMLGVPALCYLLQSRQSIRLNYWAVSRDSIFYFFSLVLLVGTLYDGLVQWYEAVAMIVLYILYIAVMTWNTEARGKFEKSLRRFRNNTLESRPSLPLLMKPIMSMPYGIEEILAENKPTWHTLIWWEEDIWWLRKIEWVITWPVRLAMLLTIPPGSVSLLRNVVTFTSCLVWVAGLSYLIAWMVTITGYTLAIPDSLMGLTFLAVGMCVPESFTSIIVARQGHGSMAISNAFGSNIFDTLLCLGLPWAVACAWSGAPVAVNSRGLAVSAIFLMAALVILYTILSFNSFSINIKISIVFLSGYVVYCVLATLTELNVFFIGNLPPCPLE